MNDNDVIKIIIQVIRAGLDSYGLTTVRIKQGYQPRSQGVEILPAVYLHKISADRYGFPSRIDVYNEGNRNFDHTETIWKTPTYQIDALSPQNPADINQLTASDIAEATAEALQSEASLRTFKQSRISIDRISTIREAYFTDDRDRYEQRPSFDFTLSYRFQRRITAPAVSSQQCRVNRVC